jgi:hypothetical protein
VARLLLANKGEVDAKDNNGSTPLHNAVWIGQLEMSELLLANKADVSAAMNDGQTPLHLAARKGCKDVVQLLLANKAEVYTMDNNGETPLKVAGSEEIAELLRQQSVKSTVNPSVWFEKRAEHGTPYLSSDFNLFDIPRYALDEWAQHVSGEPHRIHSVESSVRDLHLVTQRLFVVISEQHEIDASTAVKLFDKYLAAACPKCLRAITGNILQMIGSASQMTAVFGGGPGFERMRSGRCPRCESDHFYVVWHGDTLK